MPVNAKVKINLDFPILRFDKELSQIADKVIIPDIAGRINSGIDIENKAYRSLSKKTIAAKQKKGLRTETLIATGQLRRSFKTEVVNDRTVRITPSGTRKSSHGERIMSNKVLADILQNQGVRAKAGKRFFNFFGISDKAEVKSIKMMQNFVKDAIRRGGRKTVR